MDGLQKNGSIISGSLGIIYMVVCIIIILSTVKSIFGESTYLFIDSSIKLLIAISPVCISLLKTNTYNRKSANSKSNELNINGKKVIIKVRKKGGKEIG